MFHNKIINVYQYCTEKTAALHWQTNRGNWEQIHIFPAQCGGLPFQKHSVKRILTWWAMGALGKRQLRPEKLLLVIRFLFPWHIRGFSSKLTNCTFLLKDSFDGVIHKSLISAHIFHTVGFALKSGGPSFEYESRHYETYWLNCSLSEYLFYPLLYVSNYIKCRYLAQLCIVIILSLITHSVS